jgi:hypothetical protein
MLGGLKLFYKEKNSGSRVKGGKVISIFTFGSYVIFKYLVYLVSNVRMIVNSGLERMWKETILAYFKVLSQHLPDWVEVNHEEPQLG